MLKVEMIARNVRSNCKHKKIDRGVIMNSLIEKIVRLLWSNRCVDARPVYLNIWSRHSLYKEHQLLIENFYAITNWYYTVGYKLILYNYFFVET